LACRSGEEVIKARRLIDSADYDADVLHVMFEAFDAAWAEIRPHFEGDETAVKEARTRLAHCLLVVARAESRDAQALKDDALQVMAFSYRDRVPSRLKSE
jgi:hypothetical protein